MAAIDFSANLGKLVETIAKAVVVNSAYLTRGASKVPVDQMKGKQVGGKYSFNIPNIEAQYSTALDSDGKVALGSVSAFTTVELGVAYSGVKMPLGALTKALELGDYNELAKEIGAEIINKFVAGTSVTDISKIKAQVVASSEKELAKASAKLAATYTGKQYGFADPVVIGEIQGEGRNVQPINVAPEFGIGLEGKVFNINELRTQNLMESAALAGVFAGASKTVGQEATLAGATAGKIYISEDAQGKATSIVVATAANKGTVLFGTTPNGSSTAVASVGGYRPIIMRIDGAQAFGDAGDCLDGADSKITVGGITIAASKVKKGGFAVDYEFAMAAVAGVADADKFGIVWMKA